MSLIVNIYYKKKSVSLAEKKISGDSDVLLRMQ